MRRNLLLLLLLLLFPFQVFAQQTTVRTNLEDTYTISEDPAVTVERKITLTNTQPNRYVEKYLLSFVNSQQTQDITVLEDGNVIPFQLTRDQNRLRMEIPITKPAIGIDAKKVLAIRYKQGGTLSEFGKYRELIITPSSSAFQNDVDSYSITVYSPPGSPLSIGKPRPKTIVPGRYEWNAKELTTNANILVGFGESAPYNVELHYELPNNYPYPAKATIPLPPDGAFQRSYISSLDPRPNAVTLDADDNVLATYVVPARKTIDVTYRGTIVLYPTVQNDIQQYQRSKYTEPLRQEYLHPEKYWSLGNGAPSFSNTKEIYDYVVKTLSYDDNRLNGELRRMGASWALANPTKAVCMEYTDTFIALARSAGIPAREAVGYGAERNNYLQPVSFLGDVLHAWPEYYDTAREMWHPIDPTWGSTAGLDYFSSLDMNHLTFVYHGKDTDYPLPPGVYKSNTGTKDVYVKATTQLPQQTGMISATLPEKIVFATGEKNEVPITIRSDSNTVRYAVPLSLVDGSGTALATTTIPALPPLSETVVKLPVTSPRTYGVSQGVVTVTIDGSSVARSSYQSVAWFLRPIILWWPYIIAACCVAIFGILLIVISRHKHAQHFTQKP